MTKRKSIGAIVLALALGLMVAGASAFDETIYPDLKGQWAGVGIGQGAQHFVLRFGGLFVQLGDLQQRFFKCRATMRGSPLRRLTGSSSRARTRAPETRWVTSL